MHAAAMPDPTRDSDAVARVLLSDTRCVPCIMAETGLPLDGVLDAIATLETNVRLVRPWGRCQLCSKQRFLLTLA